MSQTVGWMIAKARAWEGVFVREAGDLPPSARPRIWTLHRLPSGATTLQRVRHWYPHHAL